MTAKSDSEVVVRFQRLTHHHEECGVGEFERPGGFVEYPYEFQTDSDGFRTGKGMPNQFDWDTYDDGSGALWIQYAVCMLDSARIEGIKTRSGEIYNPYQVVVHELNENLEQEYLVTFNCHGSDVVCPFVVAGNDRQLSIRWKEGSHKVLNGQRWTLEDEDNTSAEGKLIRSIAMLHAARNFIYGPDKPWELKDN